MEIDFNKVNDDYRKFYNSIKKDLKIIPDGHIDLCETYIISPDKKDFELFNTFMAGMEASDLKSYYNFISHNMPVDNIKLIIYVPGYESHYKNVNFSICNNSLKLVLKCASDVDNADEINRLGLSIMYNAMLDISKNSIYIHSLSSEYKRKRDGRLIPNKIVFFSRDKKPIKIYGTSISKIDWKHSWSVVGHWRKIKRLGKNRSGEYSELGRTWVNPSIKGIGTFISKPRVCIGG